MATDIGRIVLPDPEQLRRTPPVCGPAHAKHSCVVSIPGVFPRVQGECIPCSVEQTTTRLSMEMQPPVEPEKTKRQFAHRTKTGCRTCRRRKKKCDEAKPWCNNCRRGNFVCDGYTEEVPWQTGTVPTPGSLTTARGQTIAGGRELRGKYNLPSLTHIFNRETGSAGSQQCNPHPRPLTDGAGVRSQTMAVDEEGYRMPALRSLQTDWGKPPRSLDPSVHTSSLPPLRRPSFSIDEGDAEAKSPGRNHTAADSAMMLLVAHQRAQQLRTPPSRNASLPNDWHVENRKIPLGEPLEPRIVVGDNVAIGPYCQLHGPGKITVGCNSNIGAYITITTGLNSQVSIGDNVDIGEGCTIGTGVQIGHRTTVPSGTVVVYDVSTG
jgi:hypothetical protein